MIGRDAPSIGPAHVRRTCFAAAIVCALATGVSPARSQILFTAPRVVTGTVVEAGSGAPIEAAVVVLEPAPGGVLGPDRSTTSIATSRTAITATDGRYTFRDLAEGSYRLRVSRYAYRPATVEIEVRRAAIANVSVGLVVEPVAMEPVVAVLASPEPLALAGAFDRSRPARVALERDRQRRWLPSDVRTITRNDVVDGVTLAESDLFRALQRLTGVTTRDDYTAELWTRGAPWSHTRVTFDGLPLFNPLHGVGVFSGVNSDAVGAAFFFPGARPAASGEGTAALLELVSRPATSDEDLGGSAEVSLVSARAALERGGPRHGWTLAGRRSWLDLVTWAVEAAGGGDEVFVPYAFHDVTGRTDVDLGGGRVLEASGLWMRDGIRGDVPDIAEDNPSRWGNALARVTLETPLGGTRARHTAGVTRFSAEGLADPLEVSRSDPSIDDLFDPSDVRTDHELLHWTLSSAVASAGPGLERGWSLGATVIGERQRYRGPAPTPHPGRTTLDSLSTDQELVRLALWGERRLSPHPSLRFDLGARTELGGAIEHAAPVRISPRMAARWSLPGGRTTTSLAWTRGWQYTQALAPAGLSVGPRLHPNDLWFLAGDSIPALRSDVLTVGGERWMGTLWLASITGWVRRTDGMALSDPTPGPIIDPLTFVAGEGHAYGLELSLRRLAGRWTTSLGYAWTRSKTEVLERTFPASSERRHVVDAVATTRLGPSWRLGGAWRWASGAPFTRFFPATFDCGTEGDPCVISVPARVEAPNAERGPSWSTLDILVEWVRDRPGWSLSLFTQVSNVLNRDNALTYEGSHACEEAPGTCPDDVRDAFGRGLPILPVVGVRLAF